MDSSPLRSSFRVKPSLVVLIALLVGVTVLVREDTRFFSYAKIERLRYSESIRAPEVKVAVVFAQGENELYYGMQLAFADPNVWIKSANKSVRVDVVPVATGNDLNSLGSQVEIARRLSRDPSYVAVIGHSTSSVASSASVSYEENNMLYIATTATDPSLTRHNFNYVFRTIPTDEVLSEAAATLCHSLHTVSQPGATLSRVTRIGVFYEQIRHSNEVLKDLEHALTREGIAIAFERPYDPRLDPEGRKMTLSEREGEAHLESEIDRVAASRPEMIAVIGDSVQPAKALWKALSRSRLRDVPLVLMTGPLDSNSFIDSTDRKMYRDTSVPEILSLDDTPAPADGSASDQDLQPGAIYVATDFTSGEASLSDDFVKLHPQMSRIRSATQNFSRLYEQKFSGNEITPVYRIPEALAMRGYVAGQILRQAIEESASIAPVDLQQTLRIGVFQALGRTYDFSLSGDEEGFGTDKVPVIFKRFLRR